MRCRQLASLRPLWHWASRPGLALAFLLLLLAVAGSGIAAPPAATSTAVAKQLFPPELVDFSDYSHNPVFRGRGDSHWDAAIRERGWILRDGQDWRMWYTGYDGTRSGQKKLGYATSSDGLHWTRRPEPLYDLDWVEDMIVIRQQDTYYMFAEGQHDHAQLLTSPDGIHWTSQGTLDIRYADGRPLSAGPFGTPVAWHEGSTWYLMYERMDKAIWLATSNDLKVWTNVQDEPVFTPDDREHGAIAFDQVIKRDGRYYAYYHALDDPAKKTWDSNLATSDDLRHWTRYPKNPILRANQSSPVLVDDGHGLRLYTMHPEVNVHFGAGSDKPAAAK